jgi:hypothetical protein
MVSARLPAAPSDQVIRRSIAIFLLCTAPWQGVALAEPVARSDQDTDLDLIPKTVQQPPPAETRTAAPRALGTGDRLYLENAFSVSSRRSELIVPAPGPLPYNWQERLFFDVRKEWALADRLRLTYSGRLNLRGENDLSFPTHENVINDLREAYLGWHPLDRTYVEVGRINLKSGIALGYNPTDFFRTRAVVEPLSADPTVLREDRLGTLMVRAQQFWEHGSFIAAFAPGLYKPSPIYTNLDIPSLDPMFDRTNAHTRLLAKGSVNVADDFSPEFLLYSEGGQTRVGTNLAVGVGQKVVAYLEWSGGRRASLIDEALRYGRKTGLLPAETPSVLPESSGESFQNELSIGASYSTESRITFNLEYHLDQVSFTRSDWNNWFAAGRNRATAPAISGELWYLRSYALDQQDPISRHSVFLRADWVDAFVPQLELTGFVNTDLYDGSGLLQLTADYYLSDHWTVGGLVMTNFGRARSDFGSLPQTANFLIKAVRYF